MKDDSHKKLGSIKFDLPERKFDFPKPNTNDMQKTLESLNKMHAEQEALIAEEKLQEKRYNEEVLQTLKNIENNTGDISQLVSLLNDNADKQTEILEIMTEIMTIGTSSTVKEAETLYRKVMNKITQTIEDVEATEKLLGFGKIVYHSAKIYIEQKLKGEL